MDSKKLIPGKLYKLKPDVPPGSSFFSYIMATTDTEPAVSIDNLLKFNDDEKKMLDEFKIPFLFLGHSRYHHVSSRLTTEPYTLYKFCVFRKIFYVEQIEAFVNILQPM